ncbi:MAG TPA: helix-turn-helix domain-containing protein [Bacillus sp. (in: firmicutes)]|uniref:PucR family transcriptional regulator n=1 Tax=Bacillus litorisediminis TaxID=2922713 RepID=UPI001FAC7D08|nr:helix-turn-helix domain-containing protein [Bacillus litorisediminis]HWO77382.1 helix-turn-helix domain-containing protein [Bacillus sp. (in: firmicutes)]
MIEKLLSQYPTAKLQEEPPQNNKKYQWFFDENNKVYLGIQRQDLTNDTEVLLACLFEKWEPAESLVPARNLSILQKGWYSLLHDGQVNEVVGEIHHLRFIHIELLNSELSAIDIEEACTGFFNQTIQMVWLTDTSLVLIEKDSSDSIQLEDVIAFSKILEGDFYVKAKFYLGKWRSFSEVKEVTNFFQREYQLFQRLLREFGKQSYFTFERVVPYLMINQLPKDFIKMLKEEYQSVIEDPELLHTAQVYIENNMNTSLTAKKMFMHRNSLLYRIDKFTEKTGLDLKQYESAWIIYFLSLLSK